MSAENDYAGGSANDASSKNRIDETMDTGMAPSLSYRGAPSRGESILNGNKSSVESSSIPIVSAAVVATTANSAHIGGTSGKAATAAAASCNDDNQD